MEDGLDHGRLAAVHDTVSMLRAATTERVRQRLGAEGLAKGSPLAFAEMANEVLEALVGATEVKPTLGEQRQILRDVVEALKAERTAAAPKAAVAAEPVADPLHDPLAENGAKAAPEQKNKRELQVKAQVMPLLMQRIDISVASALGPEELRNQIAEIVGPSMASGGMMMLTRDPSLRRASTSGVDSSTRRPISVTIRVATCMTWGSSRNCTSVSSTLPLRST